MHRRTKMISKIPARVMLGCAVSVWALLLSFGGPLPAIPPSSLSGSSSEIPATPLAAASVGPAISPSVGRAISVGTTYYVDFAQGSDTNSGTS
ncbi:MAG: hypothetical protein L3K03_05595, partial [Thermoplasmata archaeon]|nr:hypothetical protein [Thermoplasmata archaeon]